MSRPAWGSTGEVVVQAAMNDTHAGAFATGVFNADATGLMIGTTAVILEELDHPASDLEREVVTMPTPLADQYLVMAENGLAGRPVAHALGELLAPPRSQPGTAADTFGEIPDAMAASEPGAGGVLFLPWFAGSLSPSSDPQIRGGYLGVSLATTRADMVRATLEGTARNLRWLMPAVEDMTGRPITELTFGGGAARSADWAQCIADVLGRPVSILEDPDLAAARAVAMVALGATQRGVGARHGTTDRSAGGTRSRGHRRPRRAPGFIRGGLSSHATHLSGSLIMSYYPYDDRFPDQPRTSRTGT